MWSPAAPRVLHPLVRPRRFHTVGRCRPAGALGGLQASARHFGDVGIDAAQSSEEGLLFQARSATGRGRIVHHNGEKWVCAFQVDRYWYAAPLRGIEPGAANEIGDTLNGSGGDVSGASASSSGPAMRWLRGHGESHAASAIADIGSAIECLKRPTPTQKERASLAECLPTGIIAVDVLAPIGMGQSMLICGPQGAGKSTLAREILEHVLVTRRFDKALRFCTDPCVPPIGAALQRAGALSELVMEAPVNPALSPAAFVAPLFAAVGAAEACMHAGEHAFLVLDTVAPLISAWDLALRWAEGALGEPVDAENASAQRRSWFSCLTERAAVLDRGGSLTILILAESDELAALGVAREKGTSVLPGTVYTIEDFSGRKETELERLRRLIARGVALTDANLAAMGVAPPATIASGGLSEPLPQKSLSGPMRELQSLSDGQVVLDGAAAAKGDFPAVNPGATFSRFGLGSGAAGGAGKEPSPSQRPRDVRPPALQAVAAHLRMDLALEGDAHFRPSANSLDNVQSTQMEAVRAALLQPTRAPLQMEQMVALLIAACSGALQPLAAADVVKALRGGAQSPLVQHLQEAAPLVLEAIAKNGKVSETTARELEVAIRLFVMLRKAGAASPASRAEPPAAQLQQ